MNEITTNFLVESLIFKGEEHNPFLAPRGVWMCGDRLFVADTGQNRVFIWNERPTSTFAPADVVLGQSETGDTSRNAGDLVQASTLQYPSGIWSDGQKLIVADAWNHRVLIWHTFPQKHGQPADVVVGQQDFVSNKPNVAGIGNDPNAKSLNWPYGVFSDGTQLWIADTGNRRVLYYEQIPTNNYAAASGVIGKDDFEQRDYDNAQPIWPYSVRVSPEGKMAVTDTQYYRVLLWQDWHNALKAPADVIIGQENFESNGQNQYRLQPASFTLNWCYDSFFQEDTFWVADTGNSRIMKFNPIPDKNNPAAAGLVGHDDFGTGSENKKTMFGTENALYWPFSICIDGNDMAIADTGNHRVVIKNLKDQ
ncbi:MAG: NHL repeat-containing protein [Roseivirga sp.]